jgi:hypothetical protein
MSWIKLVRDGLCAWGTSDSGKGSLHLMERSSVRATIVLGKLANDWTVGKGGSGPRSRRSERSGYVGPFDHSEEEQKTVESPLQGQLAWRVRWRGCGNRRFVRSILRRVPIQLKKIWMYLYRAVDSQGNTLEFRLSAIRDAEWVLVPATNICVSPSAICGS